jgi:hypothetical protein
VKRGPGGTLAPAPRARDLAGRGLVCIRPIMSARMVKSLADCRLATGLETFDRPPDETVAPPRQFPRSLGKDLPEGRGFATGQRTSAGGIDRHKK